MILCFYYTINQIYVASEDQNQSPCTVIGILYSSSYRHRKCCSAFFGFGIYQDSCQVLCINGPPLLARILKFQPTNWFISKFWVKHNKDILENDHLDHCNLQHSWEIQRMNAANCQSLSHYCMSCSCLWHNCKEINKRDLSL